MPWDNNSVTTADMSSSAADGTDVIVRSEEHEKQKIPCTLCSCTLNSETQAQAHFTGLRHLQQMERRGLPVTDGASMDKLVKHHRKIQCRGKTFETSTGWLNKNRTF